MNVCDFSYILLLPLDRFSEFAWLRSCVRNFECISRGFLVLNMPACFHVDVYHCYEYNLLFYFLHFLQRFCTPSRFAEPNFLALHSAGRHLLAPSNCPRALDDVAVRLESERGSGEL